MSPLAVVSVVLILVHSVSCQQWIPATKVKANTNTKTAAGMFLAASLQQNNQVFTCSVGLGDTNKRTNCTTPPSLYGYCSITVYGDENIDVAVELDVMVVQANVYYKGNKLQTMRGCGCLNQTNTFCCQGNDCNSGTSASQAHFLSPSRFILFPSLLSLLLYELYFQ